MPLRKQWPMNENECVEKPALKLYVVGESSGDPKSWFGYGSRDLVLAESAADAIAMCDADPREAVSLVDMTERGVLASVRAYV
jgi:hypothetical protein